jgi:hypothetical protein
MKRATEALAARFATILPNYRPPGPVNSMTLNAPAKLEVRVSYGSVRLHVHTADAVKLVWRARTRDRELRAALCPTVARTEALTKVSFENSSVGKNQVSVDLELYVPHGLACEVRAGLGQIVAKQISGSCKLHASMGGIDASIADSWRGDYLDFSSSMGDIYVTVPKSMRLVLAARTSMGQVMANINSYADGAKLSITAGMGNVKVRKQLVA